METKEAKSLDDGEQSRMIKLISHDEKTFELELKQASISKLVSQALESDPVDTLSIPGAKADVLALIVQYMQHHSGVEPPMLEKPLRSKLMKDVCKVFKRL